MAVGMKEPAELARRVEENPQLPAAGCERVSGYGVMGLLFRSEHVLGLRRWTASSVGEGFTSIWHRNPAGRWTFYESLRSEIACTRYFGAEVEQVRVGPIALDWQDRRRLHIYTADGAVDWTIEIGSNRRPLLTMRCSWQLRNTRQWFWPGSAAFRAVPFATGCDRCSINAPYRCARGGQTRRWCGVKTSSVAVRALRDLQVCPGRRASARGPRRWRLTGGRSGDGGGTTPRRRPSP